jgi:crotonobetainyl-CoA:carnitine CoA-transferase CaiB-like acyl-CoA transferase
MMPPVLPYSGLRVLDLGHGLAGPYCGMLLAQWGADVIKIEPREGDWLRHIGTRHGSHSALSLTANRGKRSIAADLKQPEAAAAVRRIALACDVVIESFRPGVAARLGLGYGDIARERPDVVYLSLSGFGQDGAYSQHAGSDSVMQAFSGMMALNADEDGAPRRVGFLAVDMLSGLYAFQAVAAALHGRLRGQGGRYLDVSLAQSTAAFLAPKVIEGSLGAGAGAPTAVPSGAYEVQDGYVTIALSKEAHFPVLCRAMGRDDLATDPRFANFALRAENASLLVPELAHAFAPCRASDCVSLLRSHGLLASRVNSIDDWLADPHMADAAPACRAGEAAGARVPLIPGVPDIRPDEDVRSQWPGLGGDARGVLLDVGFGEPEADALIEGGFLG